ncbi:hypothetical protein GCM10027456_55210 [Kineosporia babensis]
MSLPSPRPPCSGPNTLPLLAIQPPSGATEPYPRRAFYGRRSAYPERDGSTTLGSGSLLTGEQTAAGSVVGPGETTAIEARSELDPLLSDTAATLKADT